MYRKEYEKLVELASKDTKAVAIRGRYHNGIYPPTQFICYDALNEEDWPNHIGENSVYLMFKVDFKERKVEVVQAGHLWITEEDKKTEKFRYWAMRGMVDVAKDKGVAKFRKQGFKTLEDCQKKMEAYFGKVMAAVREYSGGYPYGKR